MYMFEIINLEIHECASVKISSQLGSWSPTNFIIVFW